MGQVRPPESFHLLSFKGEMYGEWHWSQWGGPPLYRSGYRAPGAREGCREVISMSRERCVSQPLCFENGRGRGARWSCVRGSGSVASIGGMAGHKTRKNCRRGTFGWTSRWRSSKLFCLEEPCSPWQWSGSTMEECILGSGYLGSVFKSDTLWQQKAAAASAAAAADSGFLLGTVSPPPTYCSLLRWVGVKCWKRPGRAWQLQGIIRDGPVQAASFQLRFNIKTLTWNGRDPR